MDLKIFKNEYLKWENIKRYFSGSWDKYSKIIFLLFSLAIISAGLYLWYQSLYRSDWNAEQKNQYKITNNKRIEFKEQEFNEVIDEIERKQREYKIEANEAGDIFSSYEENLPIDNNNASSNQNQ